MCGNALRLAIVAILFVWKTCAVRWLRLKVRDYFERNISASSLDHIISRTDVNANHTKGAVLIGIVETENQIQRFLLSEAVNSNSSLDSKGRGEWIKELMRLIMISSHFRRKGFQKSDPLLDQARLRLNHLMAFVREPKNFFASFRLLLHMFLETSSSALCPPVEAFKTELKALGGCVAGTLHVIVDILVRHQAWAFKHCEAAAVLAQTIKIEDALHIFPEDALATQLLSVYRSRSPAVFVDPAPRCRILEAVVFPHGNPNTMRFGWPMKQLNERAKRILSWTSPLVLQGISGHDGQLMDVLPKLPTAVEMQQAIEAQVHSAAVEVINLVEKEKRVYSQSGEDGVLECIFSQIGASPWRSYVEFGAEDGREGQARYLRAKHGFRGVSFDDRYVENFQIGLHQRRVNVIDLGSTLNEIGAPVQLDLLSVDVNGLDYVVWQNLDVSTWLPRVICIEYDSFFGPFQDSVPNRGPSIAELHRLAQSRNYSLLHVNGINAIFVRSAILLAMRRQRGVAFLDVDDRVKLCEQPQQESSWGYGRPGAHRCGTAVGLGWR